MKMRLRPHFFVTKYSSLSSDEDKSIGLSGVFLMFQSSPKICDNVARSASLNPFTIFATGVIVNGGEANGLRLLLGVFTLDGDDLIFRISGGGSGGY